MLKNALCVSIQLAIQKLVANVGWWLHNYVILLLIPTWLHVVLYVLSLESIFALKGHGTTPNESVGSHSLPTSCLGTHTDEHYCHYFSNLVKYCNYFLFCYEEDFLRSFLFCNIIIT